MKIGSKLKLYSNENHIQIEIPYQLKLYPNKNWIQIEIIS